MMGFCDFIVEMYRYFYEDVYVENIDFAHDRSFSLLRQFTKESFDSWSDH